MPVVTKALKTTIHFHPTLWLSFAPLTLFLPEATSGLFLRNQRLSNQAVQLYQKCSSWVEGYLKYLVEKHFGFDLFCQESWFGFPLKRQNLLLWLCLQLRHRLLLFDLFLRLDFCLLFSLSQPTGSAPFNFKASKVS